MIGVRLARLGEMVNASQIGGKAIPFFTLGKELVLVTRCVSEGNRLTSLAYAAGYESLLPPLDRKNERP